MTVHIDQALARLFEHCSVHAAREYVEHRLAHGDPTAAWLALGDAGAGWAGAVGETNASKAFALGMSGPVTADDLDAVENFYAECTAPCRIVVCPYADPSLLKRVGARNYRLIRFENELVRPLESIEAATDSAVEVRQVSEAEQERFARVAWLGFHGPPVDEKRAWAMAAAPFDSPNVACFLAYVDGEPAGTGAVDLRSGVANLFGGSTLPASRRRGVHDALTRARLAHAHGAGARFARVGTAPGSAAQRNLERRGFRVAYTNALMTRGG